MKPPVGKWFMVSCAKCGMLVGWTRAPLQRPFYCIPHFDDVAHVEARDMTDDETDDMIANIDAFVRAWPEVRRKLVVDT